METINLSVLIYSNHFLDNNQSIYAAFHESPTRNRTLRLRRTLFLRGENLPTQKPDT